MGIGSAAPLFGFAAASSPGALGDTWLITSILQTAAVVGVLDGAKEHRRLEEAVLARDADTAAAVLVQHLTLTAAALTDDSGQAT